MFPSSKLLPAIVAAASLALGLKVVAIAATAPALAVLGATPSAVLPDARATPPTSGGALLVQQPTPLPVALASQPPPPRAPVQPLAVQGVSLLGAATLLAPAGAGASSVPSEPTPSSSTPDVLKSRRSQVEERERKLNEREAVVAAADKRLSERVNELTILQARLQALEGGLKDRDEANWTGMVKVYEGMRPKDAASIFNALDKPVLLEILDRMKPAKATPVIAAMEPEKARQVTADLSAKRTRSTTVAN